MKIKVERVSNILKLPEETAFLEGVGSEGQTFIYKICYEANINNAIKNEAINVKIRILKDQQRQKNYNIFTTGLDSNDIVNNLLSQKAKQKDLVKSKNDLILFQTESDISKKIPNGKSKATVKKLNNVVKKIESVNNENVNLPILTKNRIAFNDGLGIDQKIFKEEMKNILLKHNTDPAVFLGQKNRSIISTANSFNGVIDKQVKTNHRVPASRKLELVTENLLSTTNPTSTSELSKDEYVSFTSIVENEFVLIEEFVEIPVDLLMNPTFLIEFELFDRYGISQQVLTTKINHREKFNELLIPILPPTINATPTQKLGKVVLSVKQNDKNCDRVNIYRRTVLSSQINTDSNFIFINSVKVDVSDGFVSVVDDHASINPTIYRVVAVSKNGSFGAEFNSVVINQEKNKTKLKNILRIVEDNVVSLTHKIENGFITIYVENIPSGVVSLELLRKDLSLKEKTAKRISNRIFVSNDNGSFVTVRDITAKKDRVYEYFCRLIYKNGEEIIANNKIITKYENIESNISNLEQIIPTINEQDLNVEFQTTKNTILNNLDIVKKILTEQNIIEEYQSDLTNEKERLQNLFFTRVLRANKITGEVEDFGIIDETTFSDKKYGQVRNVKPLESGIEYCYTVMVYALPAEIVFEKYTRKVKTTYSEYDLLPSKWLHPYTLKNGTIVNNTTLKAHHSNSIFTFGKVVDIQYVNVNLGDILPSVTSCVAQKTSSSKTLVKWKVSGDAKKIDHFVVSLQTMGSRTIVGKSHNISSTNDYHFIDILDNNEHGALSYIITPIYFDFSQGSEIFSNTIFI